MSKKPYIYDAIFIDRDGTLNPDPGYISSLKDFQLYSFSLDALKSLSTLSPHLCIITNQSGISRGLIEKDELDKIHSYLIGNIEQENMAISGLYVCTDLPGTGSKRRKPQPGMFFEAEKDLSIKPLLPPSATARDANKAGGIQGSTCILRVWMVSR